MPSSPKPTPLVRGCASLWPWPWPWPLSWSCCFLLLGRDYLLAPCADATTYGRRTASNDQTTSGRPASSSCATSSGPPAPSSGTIPSGCAAYSSDGITSGRPASSSGATNSYWPAFSCGVTTWAGLPAPPAGPPLAAGVEGEFCCSTVFLSPCHLHAHALFVRVPSLPFSPTQQQEEPQAGVFAGVSRGLSCGCGPGHGCKSELFLIVLFFYPTLLTHRPCPS